MNRNLFFCILYLYLGCFSIYAQNEGNTVTVTDTFQINLENKYKVSSVSVIPGSESLFLNRTFISEGLYTVNYAKGEFTLSDSVKYSLIDTLYFSYQSYRLSLKKEYRRRSLVYRYDENLSDSIRVAQIESEALTTESIFGENIQQSGTIVRGFTVGTTKDFSLESGLRLQLAGQLSDEISIVAALTDENTPIEPEGNTETLDELDKVFIEIRHPHAVGTFGDYDYNFEVGEFGTVDRKLQGLQGQAIFDNFNAVVAVASSKGEFTTNEFEGDDSNQGPYRLEGEDGETDITVIAGSEKVYVDGEEMTRGENNDYVIEYSNAEITFTTKKLITSASRIVVDFEYSARQYERNFFAGNSSVNLLKGKMNIAIGLFEEYDDKNNPVDITLSDDEIELLRQAGDDREKAVETGVSLADLDSNGVRDGNYVKADTTIDGEAFTYYYYEPGNDSAIYNVSFTYVGSGNGDYKKQGLGNYEFVGIGEGSYLPINYVPLPSTAQLGNIVISGRPVDNINIEAEIAGSNYDQNTYSDLDDNDNFGYARNLEISLDPTQVNIGKLSLGKVGINFKDRFIQETFNSLDRVDEIEFNRYYNITDDEQYDEILRKIGLRLIPVNQLNVYSEYSYLKNGESSVSDRFVINAVLEQAEQYSVNFDLDNVYTVSGNYTTDWERQNGDASYTFGNLKPGIEYLYENKLAYGKQKDSLLTSSYRYLEFTPYFEVLKWKSFDLSLKYSIREESYPIDGILYKQSDARTQQYSLGYSGSKSVNSDLSFTFRKKEYTDIFVNEGYTDNETILVNSQSRFNFWDRFLNGSLFYEVSTERSAVEEKVFVLVEDGKGNYVYKGDTNGNGIKDESEFELDAYDGNYVMTTVQTDELYPVIDLDASTRWQADFSKMMKGHSLFDKLLNPIYSETYWRVEENSKEEDTKKIYLMDFSHFLNDSTTISGSNLFQQDMYLFKSKKDLSFRFRYTQRKSLTEYSTGMQRGYYREKAMRITFQMIEEISNQTEYENTVDNVVAPDSTDAMRVVTNELSTDFSYRPQRNMEFGFEISVGESRDSYPTTPTVVDINSQVLSMNLNFKGKGRLRLEVERTELIANDTENTIPFEITSGSSIGKNYYWQVNFDYRIANNLQTTINYNGRLQGSGNVVHTLSAEARAYF